MGHPATRSHLETAQPLAAKHSDRSRQVGAAMESATGRAACPRTGTRTSQPCHAGRGPQTRHLSAGRRQKRAELSAAGARTRRPSGEGRDTKNQNRLRKKNFKTTGDRPAVPRQLGDWAEESRLPMLLTVCIEAGRQTLTHTSWTGLRFGSRKWMSGQAAALAARDDRRLWLHFTPAPTLRGSTLPSERRSPSPLDFYLSWMSPISPISPAASTHVSKDETWGTRHSPLLSPNQRQSRTLHPDRPARVGLRHSLARLRATQPRARSLDRLLQLRPPSW